MAIIDPVPLGEHVLCLGGCRVARAELVDVVVDVGEEVGAVARGLKGVAEAGEVAAVFGELFAEEGEVVLF
jgi:hypothetical protein